MNGANGFITYDYNASSTAQLADQPPAAASIPTSNSKRFSRPWSTGSATATISTSRKPSVQRQGRSLGHSRAHVADNETKLYPRV
ncbi:MAG: hypothetical protein MZU97_26480 [Bacillus subtilis]|nr:hypothetical protein [Bacillus subtilis]